MKDYPMWHRRFTDARNHLAEACGLMEQAYFEDGDNPKFKALHEKMHRLLVSVDKQWTRNCNRGRKEGWLARK